MFLQILRIHIHAHIHIPWGIGLLERRERHTNPYIVDTSNFLPPCQANTAIQIQRNLVFQTEHPPASPDKIDCPPNEV